MLIIVPMLLPANNQNFDVQKTHVFLRNMYSEFEMHLHVPTFDISIKKYLAKNVIYFRTSPGT